MPSLIGVFLDDKGSPIQSARFTVKPGHLHTQSLALNNSKWLAAPIDRLAEDQGHNVEFGMNQQQEQQLKSVRAWFKANKDVIRVTALAKRMNVDNTKLARALTDDVEQQRNVSPEFLWQIVETISSLNYEKRKRMKMLLSAHQPKSWNC